jgi:hypothetical protein
VIAAEDPPGFVVCTEAQKVAFDNGFRIERGTAAGWIRYASTTAHGQIWIAETGPQGPWFLSIDHRGVAAEMPERPPTEFHGPGIATWTFPTLGGLYAALHRVYKLDVSLPAAPLARFGRRRTRRRLMPSSHRAARRPPRQPRLAPRARVP